MNCVNLGNFYFTNYLLRFPQGHILVDAGNKTTYAKFLKALAKQNVDVKDIRYVVLTHTHDDHISYLADLLADNPQITFLCHSAAVARLAADKMVIGYCTSRSVRFSSNLMDKLGLYAPYPTTVVKNAVEVDKDPDYLAKKGYPVRFTMLPGHTIESIGMVVEEKYYFVGDTMFNVPPAKHLIPLVMEDLEAYKASFVSILNEGAETLYFGHGNPIPTEKAKRNLRYLDGIRLYEKYPAKRSEQKE